MKIINTVFTLILFACMIYGVAIDNIMVVVTMGFLVIISLQVDIYYKLNK